MGLGVAVGFLLLLATVLTAIATTRAASRGVRLRKAILFGCGVSALATLVPVLLFTVLVIAPHL